ncbi:hypothetical protein ACFVP2_39750 [Streptomyces alboflavus]|uniref:Mom family adenine methylcarbamoylation protein n=1 Tax=Streptomyces alboflavus TaxID=67267 RepID=UPI003679AE30
MGTVYQAGNWIYTGTADSQGGHENGHVIRGREYAPRAVRKAGWKNNTVWLREHVDPNATPVEHVPKLRYLYPLDKGMRRQIAPLARPFPKPESSAFEPCDCGGRLDVPKTASRTVGAGRARLQVC